MRAGKLSSASRGLEVANHGPQGTSTARIPAGAGTAPSSLGLGTHLVSAAGWDGLLGAALAWSRASTLGDIKNLAGHGHVNLL